MFKERQFIDELKRQAMTTVNCVVAAFSLQITEVLWTTGAKDRREKVSCAVVDRMAPGVRHLKLQAVGEAPVQLGL